MQIVILILQILTALLMLVCMFAVIGFTRQMLREVVAKVNKNTDDDFAEALTFIYNMDKVKDVANDVDEVMVE